MAKSTQSEFNFKVPRKSAIVIVVDFLRILNLCFADTL